MSLFTLYIISVLPSVSGLLVGMAAFACPVLVVVTIVLALIYSSSCSSDKEGHKKRLDKWVGSLKYSITGIILVSLLSCFIPSEKQLYMIAGGYVATNTKDIDKLPVNIIGAVNAYLETAQKEAKK